jgi:hypothetical protein
MRYLITTAAVLAALLTVLGTRFIIPTLTLVFRAIEATLAKAEEEPAEPVVLKLAPAATAVVEAAPVKTVAKAAVSKPRATRKRRTPSKPSPAKVATA